MAYTSVTYADISSGTEVRRTEPKCPHISKLSKETSRRCQHGADRIFLNEEVPHPDGRGAQACAVSHQVERSRRCQHGADRNFLNEEAPNGATVRRRSTSRWARRTAVCAVSHQAESRLKRRRTAATSRVPTMTAPPQRPARQTPLGSAGQACIGLKSPFTGTEWTPPFDARLAQKDASASIWSPKKPRCGRRAPPWRVARTPRA